MKVILKFVGGDSWSRPVYAAEDGTLFVDTDPRADRPMNLCTKVNNALDGEPDTPIEYTRYRDCEVEVDQRVVWY